MRALPTSKGRRLLRGRPEVGAVVVDVVGGTRTRATAQSALRAIDGPVVVVCPLGSPGAVEARRLAAADPRVTWVEGDWEVALHQLRRLSSRYAFTLTGGDDLAPASVLSLVRDLHRSGSELALAGLRRPDGVTQLMPWQTDGLERAHCGLTLAEFPAIAGHTKLGAALASQRLLRRLDSKIADRGPVPLLLALIMEAGSIDLHAEGMLRPGTDAGPNIFGSFNDTSGEVITWLRALSVGHRMLQDLPVASAFWGAGVARDQAGAYLDSAELWDEAALYGMCRYADGMVDPLIAGSATAWSWIDVETRAQLWLLARRGRDALAAFNAARRVEPGIHFTIDLDQPDRAFHAALRGADDVDEVVTSLGIGDVPLQVKLSSLRWDDSESKLDFELFVVLRDLQILPDEDVDVRVWLRAEDGSDHGLTSSTQRSAAVARFAEHPSVLHDQALVTGSIPTSSLVLFRKCQLVVEASYRGVQRRAVVRLCDAGGSVAMLPARRVGRHEVAIDVAPQRLVIRASTASGPPPAEPAPLALRLDGEQLTIASPHRWRLLDQDDEELPPVQPGQWLLRRSRWSGPAMPLASGRWSLVADAEQTWPADFVAQLPMTLHGDFHRIVVRVVGRRKLQLQLGPPLSDCELGQYQQRRMQREAVLNPGPLQPDLVYFQSYAGRAVTDSPRQISAALAQSRPDLRQVWATVDHSIPIPETAERVIWRSQQWHQALTTARYVVTNTELERWFRRRPEQTVLQTFHGYPAKSMGIGLWQAKRFPPSRIEQQLDSTARQWSVALTPSPEMDEHYRREYRYEGVLLNQGYPRDDELIAPGAEEQRNRARGLLELGDRTAVLYAPTWRDDLATNYRSAAAVNFLDVAATARGLGPEFVLLLRGHRFTPGSRHRDDPESARVIDVTDYPEINDLILAADVAVLDYSSLRFDWAITGKPMVFLVPDLETYTSSTRGFLFDFLPTAPGPILRSSMEVVQMLQALATWPAQFRKQLEEFNARFNAHQDGHATERVVGQVFGRPV